MVSGIPGPRHDYRLGTFYQGGDPKRAYRVNGRPWGKRLELWFDPENPNLRPDELTGARLLLKMSDDGKALTGSAASAKRLLEPEEVAETAAFLLGPGGRAFTGAPVVMDLGWTAR